jgi:hypothetical protein
MKDDQTIKTFSRTNRFNRYAYVIYLILVVYLFVKEDYEWAFINLSMSLVFDPFDVSIKWQNRTLYQRGWLLVHVTLVFAGLIFLWFIKSK